MSLDITAYSKLAYVTNVPNRADANEKYSGFDDNFAKYYLWLSATKNSFNREAPLVRPSEGVAIYRCDGEKLAFGAGTYGGYNTWRNHLSLMATRYEAKRIWNVRDLVETRALPFYELIDFSDAEGVIGSFAAKELVVDFAMYQTLADAQADEYFRTRYTLWRKACDLAADGGAIDFH